MGDASFSITMADTKPIPIVRGVGKVTVTVHNLTNRTAEGRLIVKPQGSVAANWVTVKGEREREFPGNANHQFTVEINPPPDAQGGSHTFNLRVVAVNNPDADFTQDLAVRFEVPSIPLPSQGPERKKWPYVVAACAAVLIVGGIFAWILIPKGEELKAAFEADPKAGPAPLAVAFKDTSTGKPEAWKWDFGDGKSSTEANPSNTFEKPGANKVTLTVTRKGSSASHEATIEVKEAVNAAFESKPKSGSAPLTVAFADKSTGNPRNWKWDFGDGKSSADASPSHTFEEEGTYGVSLLASGPDEGNASTAEEIIIVKVPPKAMFAATPKIGPATLHVEFTDQSRGDIASWSWDFGDGSGADSKSMEQNPTHDFKRPGKYKVKLTVMGAAETEGREFISEINVLEPTKARFTASPLKGIAPLSVTFKDNSPGNPTSWTWVFGDNTQPAISQNTSHEFKAPGRYQVTLKVSGSGGEHTSIPTEITVYKKAEAGFLTKTTSTIDPLMVYFTSRSTGDIGTYNWSFGDGTKTETFKSGSPFSHVFNKPGTFAIRLTVKGNGGEDSSTQNIIVKKGVNIPEVRGKTLPDAVATLRAAELKVKIANSLPELIRNFVPVRDQVPRPGRRVEAGSTVTLFFK